MSQPIKTFDCAGCRPYCYGGFHMEECKDGDGDYVLSEDFHAALSQRDELLAALKSVNESAVCFAKNEYSISADAISKVENAIAGVEGGAT